MTIVYSLPAKGAALMALMEAFSRLSKRLSEKSGGSIGLPDAEFTANELLAESAFPPEDGEAFIETLTSQGFFEKQKGNKTND